MRVDKTTYTCPTDAISKQPVHPNINIGLKFASNADSVNKISADELVEKLYKQIKSAGINSKTIALLAQIDKNNVIDVINSCPKNLKTLGLDAATIRQYILAPLLFKAKEMHVDLSDYKNIDLVDDSNKLSDSLEQIIKLINNKQEADKIVRYSKSMQEKHAIKEKVDVSEFSVENITKKYPSDKFKIDIDKLNNEITVKVSSLDGLPVSEYQTSLLYDEYYNYSKTNYDKSGRVLEKQTISDGRIVFSENYDYVKNKSSQYNYDDSGKLVGHRIYDIVDGRHATLLSETFDNGSLECKFVYDADSLVSSNFYNSSGFVKRVEKYNTEYEYFDNGNIKSVKDEKYGIKSYNTKGELIYTEEKGVAGRNYAAADYFVNTLKAHGENNYKFKESILSVNTDNVIEILEQFSKTSGSSLIKKIQDSKLTNADKTKLVNHITGLLEEKFGYNKNYVNNNSKIDNKYYKGDEYSVKFNGYNAEIYNKTKNQNYSLDLDYLLKDVTVENKIQFASIIQKLPGQVLEDLSIECCGIMKNTKDSQSTLLEKSDTIKKVATKVVSFFGYDESYFSSAGQVVQFAPWMSSNFDGETLVHELGHLVDFGCDNYYFPHIYSDTYDKEREAYLKNISDGEEKFYASTNSSEFFAEVYQAMMLGKSEYLDKLSKSFPKSVENVKKEYEKIRTTSVDNRNEWKNATNLELKNANDYLKAPDILMMKALSPIGDLLKKLSF